MSHWFVLLTPLVVLPIALLFLFVGCDLNTEGTGDDVVVPKPKPVDPPTFTIRYEQKDSHPDKPAFADKITGQHVATGIIVVTNGFPADMEKGIVDGQELQLFFSNDVPDTPVSIRWVCNVMVRIPTFQFTSLETAKPIPTFVAKYESFKKTPKTLVLRRLGDLTFDLKEQ